jgi:hypothetical protein
MIGGSEDLMSMQIAVTTVPSQYAEQVSISGSAWQAGVRTSSFLIKITCTCFTRLFGAECRVSLLQGKIGYDSPATRDSGGTSGLQSTKISTENIDCSGIKY